MIPFETEMHGGSPKIGSHVVGATERKGFVFLFFSSFDYPGFSRPSKSIKRIVFVGIVDEVNPQKCPGIPGEVKKSIAKIIVFLQLVVMKWIPTSKS